MDEINLNISENFDSSNKRRKRKILLLIFSMAVTSTILIVSTYAWFTGTATVSINPFAVSIDTDDGLQLSLNGTVWTTVASPTLSLSKEIILGTDATATNKGYSSNKNKWPDGGLSPVSSAGQIDTTNSVLKLYGESSITATLGGYRLIATQIDNSTAEKEGYVAFDLFIRNGLEDSYIPAYNQLDDEAIYLTTGSSVTVTAVGGQPDKGLANSVRVAFVQIARAKYNNTSVFTGMTCAGSGTGQTAVTGLCSNVTPTIWEPNNKLHDSALITYFNTVCKKKTVSGGVVSYGTACTALANNTYVNTYVVKQDILSSDNVDIYDGLNNFTVGSTYPLMVFDTFTDDEKNVTGANRPPFMYLAANSVTKVRVYVYLEGQDVDNYDLISNGNQITIQFGFTKDKLNIASS